MRQSVALTVSGEEATIADVEIIKRRDPRSILHLSWAEEPNTVPGMLQKWIEEGVLVEDSAAHHYIYEYSLAGQRVRGVIGSLEISGEDMDSRVLPHEGLVEAALDGFCRRVDQARLDVEPVLLVQSFSKRVQEAMQLATSGPPIVEMHDAKRDYHRLWAISSPSLQRELAVGIASNPALLADGHHRYAAHQRTPERPEGPGRVLTMVVDSEEHSLELGPIHRVIPGFDPAQISELLNRRGWSGSIETLECSAEEAKDYFELSAEAVFLIGGGTCWHLLGGEDRDPGVVQAHSRLFPLLDVVSSQLDFRHLWEKAVDLASATGGTAVLLKSMSFDEVVTVAQSGRTLPEKATSFAPKPIVTMVMCRL